MDPFALQTVRDAYERAAYEYTVAYGDDLKNLPLDCEMLMRAADLCPRSGVVLEVGSGPAPASAFLDYLTQARMALDLSHAMLTLATDRVPGLATVQGDIRHLPLVDGCCSLVVAFYVVQHIPRRDLPALLAEFRRILSASGVLVLAIHLGEGDVFVDEFLGHLITPMGGTLFGRGAFVKAVCDVGFAIEDESERGPVKGEFESQRLYVVARRSCDVDI